jgi:hypothetical protein
VLPDHVGAKSAAHAVRIGLETGALPGSEVAALRTELGRVYTALAEANSRLVSQAEVSVVAHPFGEYLLQLRDVA